VIRRKNLENYQLYPKKKNKIKILWRDGKFKVGLVAK
jgi:hypothetical protein